MKHKMTVIPHKSGTKYLVEELRYNDVGKLRWFPVKQVYSRADAERLLRGLEGMEDKTSDENQPSLCDYCIAVAILWAHDDSNGDEKLLCKKHAKLYRDWRCENL